MLVGTATAPRAQEPATDGWRTFEGSWSAVGRRETLPAGQGRVATLIELSGSVTLNATTGLPRGFKGQVIGFDDGEGNGTGRAVWTDANGDQVFSLLRGESPGAGRRIAGTFTGGTGRYAGASGDYTLTWQYVVQGDEEAVQGRAVDLRGRLRASGLR